MKKTLELLKSQVPFELRRYSSWISIIVALVATGFLLNLGTKLSDSLYQTVEPYFPIFINSIVYAFSYPVNVKINLISLLFFIIVFFTLYRVLDRVLLSRLRNTAVFSDDFDFSNKGWMLNYWGSNDPDKTCRYEDSSLVFEANSNDLVDSRKEYGAYYDLVTGIYEYNKYEVSCKVRADKGTTMGIKLWVHDIKGHNAIKSPADFYTPGEIFEEMRVGFTGTSSQGLRIHLHLKHGAGKIYVDSVTVLKK